MRSPFAPVVLPIAALIGALVRWQVQGSHNVWTAIDKRFYIPDPDLGWRISERHPVWLGLEISAVIAAIAIGLGIGGWIIRRREARRGQRATVLRAASWVLGGATLAVPIAAFASGGGPANGLDTLPPPTIRGIEAGITGILDAPAGRYEIVEHPGTAITARLSAGHEAFDARLASGIRGAWQGDPHDLTRPIGGEISVDAASVDTGIDERSKHAREEYLHADKHPRITLALDRVLSATQSGANTVGFRAHGTLGFIGKTHSIEVTGTLKKPDAAALARLGLKGDILLVQADFALVIKETALAGDAGDFDGDRIPVHVSLVMRHTSG
ncbi:MAG TPA: YceI family protein [Kofleriaceae bacterium]|nr:YceI family protein [Kofleriaceae bacterium]